MVSFPLPCLLQIREVDPALGAGLELTADPYGFLIETVDETPGQRRPNWTVSWVSQIKWMSWFFICEICHKCVIIYIYIYIYVVCLKKWWIHVNPYTIASLNLWHVNLWPLEDRQGSMPMRWSWRLMVSSKRPQLVLGDKELGVIASSLHNRELRSSTPRFLSTSYVRMT